MNLKNKLRKFFTLSRRHEAGFTLIELIVVIAILGILGGVAVPVYSGYMKKANMQADRTLVSEIENALMMGFYNGNFADGEMGFIKLTADGVSSDSVIPNSMDTAMKAAYGDDWRDTMKLKWDGWKGENPTGYVNTNYYGNEEGLLDEVSRLSGALADAFAGGFKLDFEEGSSEGFGGFVGEYGMDEDSDSTALGNAAVLYVAQQTSNNGDTIITIATEKFIKPIEANPSSANTATNALNNTYNELSGNVGDAAALAVIYALAEGFAQYCDVQTGSDGNAVSGFHKTADFSNTRDAYDALAAVGDAFGYLYQAYNEYLPGYVNTDSSKGATPALNDLAGYVSIMGTVNNNKAVVDGNLASDTCFTDGTVVNMLNGYAALSLMNAKTADGQMAVSFVVQDGGISITVLPFNWNK